MMYLPFLPLLPCIAQPQLADGIFFFPLYAMHLSSPVLIAEGCSFYKTQASILKQVSGVAASVGWRCEF